MPRDSYTGKTISWATCKKLVYPYPIFQAHMSDGRVIRMAFWAPNSADDTELIERARRFACLQIRHCGEPYQGFVGEWPEAPYNRDDRVIRLYVEDQRCNGPWLIDPVENLERRAGSERRPRYEPCVARVRDDHQLRDRSKPAGGALLREQLLGEDLEPADQSCRRRSAVPPRQ